LSSVNIKRHAATRFVTTGDPPPTVCLIGLDSIGSVRQIVAPGSARPRYMCQEWSRVLGMYSDAKEGSKKQACNHPVLCARRRGEPCGLCSGGFHPDSFQRVLRTADSLRRIPTVLGSRRKICALEPCSARGSARRFID